MGHTWAQNVCIYVCKEQMLPAQYVYMCVKDKCFMCFLLGAAGWEPPSFRGSLFSVRVYWTLLYKITYVTLYVTPELVEVLSHVSMYGYIYTLTIMTGTSRCLIPFQTVITKQASKQMVELPCYRARHVRIAGKSSLRDTKSLVIGHSWHKWWLFSQANKWWAL